MQTRAAISIVVPYPPGGSTDLVARLLASELARRTGTRFEVRNIDGDHGFRAFEFVSKAEAPTLLLGNIDTSVVTPALFANDSRMKHWERLEPLTRVAAFPLISVVAASSMSESFKDLLAAWRETAQPLRWGVDWLGSAVDLLRPRFTARTGVVTTPVTSDGGAVGIRDDLVAGRTDFAYLNSGIVLESAAAGLLKPLAVMGWHRLGRLPQTPTISELGYGGLELTNWQALFVPRAACVDFKTSMFDMIANAARSDVVRAALTDAGAEANSSPSPSAFAAEIAAEIARLGT